MRRRTVPLQIIIGLGLLLVVFGGVTSNELLRGWGIGVVSVGVVLVILSRFFPRS